MGTTTSTAQHRAHLKAILGWKGRGLTVYPDDTFLVSYPRSGNTWTRFLAANLVFTSEPATFLSVERQVPDIYSHSDSFLRRVPRPRLIKSHECFDPRYKRVIYIVRDPRDVAVSFYHQSVKHRRIPDGYPMATFVEQWAEAHWEPEFGTWGEHVKSWLATRGEVGGFLLVRYRDLLQGSQKELYRIACFLGLERSDAEISRAIELSSADRMRTLEKKQQNQWIATRSTRLDKPFVRKAKVGDWRTSLPRESVELIEAAWGPLMESLGYPTGAKARNAEPETPTAVHST